MTKRESFVAKVIVTGGAGFIGSHLCDALIERGDYVVCIDSLVGTDGSTRNIDHLLENPRFEFIEADISEFASYANHAQPNPWTGVDCVFNLAAAKNVVCMNDPVRDLATNAVGTLQLLQSAKASGVRKFVHASTGSVYGESDQTLSEDHPRNPASFYGISKTAGDSYCRLFTDLYGMNCSVLRYFHVIGSRQSLAGVVPIFVTQAVAGNPLTIYGSGKQERSFTSVHDVVRANLLASEQDSGVYNVASGVRVTIREMADFIVAETESESEILYEDWRAGDVVKFNVDNSKIDMSFSQDWQAAVREVIEERSE